MRRLKDFRLPENCVLVARPSRFGNPYKITKYGRDEALRRYRTFLASYTPDQLREFLRPLAGKDLACFCKLSESCHVDILIEKMHELFPMEAKEE